MERGRRPWPTMEPEPITPGEDGITNPASSAIVPGPLRVFDSATSLAGYGPFGAAIRIAVAGTEYFYSKNLTALAAVRDRALVLAPAAVAEATGFDELGKLVAGLLSGLIAMMMALAVTTVLGGVIGGAVGFFFGVAGAAPGAVIGAKLGMETGLALLTWIGVGFLAVSIVRGFDELADHLKTAIERGWNAGEMTIGEARQTEIEAAAQELAKAVGVLIRLILEGILAYLTRSMAASTKRNFSNTVRQVKSVGTETVAAETVASLVSKLRRSRLGKGFADWVELNWQKLLENPKLRRPPAAVGVGVTTEAVTPSQLGKSVKAEGGIAAVAPKEPPQTGAGSFLNSADDAYARIRAWTDDVEAIAKHTSIKPTNIQKVKNHLFYDSHLLDRYESIGVPGVVGRFDSDAGIAAVWQRLSSGRGTASDLQLLRHETVEAWYMRKHGPRYNSAHCAAEARYPAPNLGD